ncbi:hypothetical protein AAHC03_026219 [Spirometra sp. Aus1]
MIVQLPYETKVVEDVDTKPVDLSVNAVPVAEWWVYKAAETTRADRHMPSERSLSTAEVISFGERGSHDTVQVEEGQDLTHEEYGWSTCRRI